MRNKEESREGGWEKQQGAMKKLVKVLEEGERERENKSAKGRWAKKVREGEWEWLKEEII